MRPSLRRRKVTAERFSNRRLSGRDASPAACGVAGPGHERNGRHAAATAGPRAGPLDGGSRRGFFLYPVEAFTPSGLPLGPSRQIWTRRNLVELSPATMAVANPASRRLRWLEGLRSAREVAQQVPQTTCVCVAIVKRTFELLRNHVGKRRCRCWCVLLGSCTRQPVRGPRSAFAFVRAE